RGICCNGQLGGRSSPPRALPFPTFVFRALGSGLGASAGPPAVKAQLLPTGLQSKTEGRKRRLQNLRFPIDQPQEFRIDGEAFSLGGSPVEPEGPLGQVLEPVRPQGERTPAIAQRDVAQGMTETPVRCEGAWQNRYLLLREVRRLLALKHRPEKCAQLDCGGLHQAC